MPWALAGVAVSAGVGLASGAMQSSAVGKGRDAALNAQREAMANAREDLSPWMGAGQNALMVTSNLAGANGPDAATTAMKDFYTSPGYQWRLDQGLRGVDAGAAAKGMLQSGATLKEEQTFGEGLASQEFSNYYNRLFGLSQQGQQAASSLASGELSSGQQIAGTEIGAANAQSSIIGNTGQTISTAANGLFSNKDFTSWLGSGSSSKMQFPEYGY